MGSMGGEGEVEGEVVWAVVGHLGLVCLAKKLRTLIRKYNTCYKSGIWPMCLHGSLSRIAIVELGQRGEWHLAPVWYLWHQ